MDIQEILDIVEACFDENVEAEMWEDGDGVNLLGRQSFLFAVEEKLKNMLDNEYICDILSLVEKNMKQYKGYEVTAINTNGLWYGYATLDNVTVFNGRRGYLDRADAIAEAEVAVTDFSTEATTAEPNYPVGRTRL